MEYRLNPSFKRTLKKIPSKRKEKVKESIQKLVIFFETGEKTKGLGLKKLPYRFWEIRTDIRDRILFRVKENRVEFVIVGDHQEIKRYLRNI